MAKTYLIETITTFTHGYFVEMDDDMDPRVIAEKICSEPDNVDIVEGYQYFSGEKFDQCIPTSIEQIPRIFRAKNSYLAQLDDEDIINRFTLDYRTDKD